MPPDPSHSLHEELPRQAEWVRRLARRLVRDEGAAEDLAQETALASLRVRSPLRGALKPWLARVAANLARRGWRDAETRRHGERAAARPELLPATDEVLGRLEIQGLLVEELKGLPEPLRNVLVRHYFDGRSLVRIARDSGLPASTVRWHLQRALAELRQRLDRRQNRDGISWRPALVALSASRFPWQLGPTGHGSTLLGPLQGALAMKVTTQIALVGVVLVTGLGVYLATDGEGEKHAAPPALAPVTETLRAELPPPVVQPLQLEPAESREALAASTAAPAAHEPAPRSDLRRPIDGRVVDHALVPVAGARVRCQEDPGATSPPSGGDGSFALTCPAKGDASRLFRVEAEGYGTRFVSAVIALEDTTHLGDLVLEPGGSVRGRVLTSTDAACEGAEVRVTGTELWESLEAARRSGPGAELPGPKALSARDGTFLVTGVPAGMARVWASAPGMLHAVTLPIDVPAHGEPEELVLTLEPLERLDHVSGVVLDPEDQPVPQAGLRVNSMLSSGGNRIWSVKVDGDGRFELPAPPGSVFDFTISDREERWVPLTSFRRSSAEGEIELRFVATPWIDVVVRSGAEPVTDFAVVASAPDDEDAGGVRAAHPDGRARVHAPLGSFTVLVDAPGYQLARRGPFEAASAPAKLEFDLVSEPGLRGRVTVYGQPVSGARVTLHDADPRNHIDHNGYPSVHLPEALDETLTDGEGRFLLRARAPGDFVVRAESEGLAAADAGPFTFDPARGRTDLELALTRGGAIEGRVFMPAGREASGVIVAVNRGDAHARTMRSGEDGRFRFEALTPGPWHVARGKLEITADENGTAYDSTGRVEIPFNCQVDDGQTTQRNVDLRDWEPCLLHGELLANGAPLENWQVMVWPSGRTAIVGELPTTTTDQQGRFRVQIEEAGPMRLDLLPPRDNQPLAGAPSPGLVVASGTGGHLSIEIEVHSGDSPWRTDIALGRLEGTIAGAQPGERLYYEALAGEPVGCLLPIRVDANGRFTLPIVPAGRGQIQRMQGTGSQRKAVPLVEVEVPARGTREVHVR